MTQNFTPDTTDSKLTLREAEILKRKVASGLNSKQLAKELCVSKRTVDFHLANAYEKLDAHNLMQAYSKAIKKGYITP